MRLELLINVLNFVWIHQTFLMSTTNTNTQKRITFFYANIHIAVKCMTSKRLYINITVKRDDQIKLTLIYNLIKVLY